MKPKSAILGIAIILNVAQTIWSQVPSTNRVLSFDGNSSYVSIPSSPLIQNSNEITVEAWIYPLPPTTNPDHGWFVAKSDGINLSSARTFELDWWVSGGNTGIGIGLEANFFLGTTNWAVVGVAAPLSNWVHVAATYSVTLGLLRLYTNGIEAAATTRDATGVLLAGRTLRQTTQPLVFGGSASAFANGYLDEVRIWNKAKVGFEILRDFRKKLSGTETNLMAYWKFDDGTAIDQTSNRFVGTFLGNATTVADTAKTTDNIVHAVEIFFSTGFGSTFYQVQYSTDASSTNWTALGRVISGNGLEQSIFDKTRDGTQKFYRVVSY